MVSPPISAGDSSCANRSQVRFKTTSPGADAIYKTAMSAFLSGKKLMINPYPGTSCISNITQAWYVYITN